VLPRLQKLRRSASIRSERVDPVENGLALCEDLLSLKCTHLRIVRRVGEVGPVVNWHRARGDGSDLVHVMLGIITAIAACVRHPRPPDTMPTIDR